MVKLTLARGVEVLGSIPPEAASVLTGEALEFVADLQRRFGPAREELLRERAARQARLDGGERPDFPHETRRVREDSWSVAPAPEDLEDRRVEITGPVDRKMMINALNSGARVFMADFEDALCPTWTNVVEGQAHLMAAVRRTLGYVSPDGREYRLGARAATLLVRPRGWHLVERHLLVDGRPAAASLVDAGLYLFHNAHELLRRGTAPYLYLPKLEGRAEARLWNEVLTAAETALGIAPGRSKVSVLIETVLAAFEMEEILWELRDRSPALNAGRWDYIFSLIKKFRRWPDFVLPDRAEVTMTVPFMRAYTELLVQAAHRRGAHAIGGMAAFVPNRKDPEVTRHALERVRDDKRRESADGFDGTWVAHPDLVPVAAEIFGRVLGTSPHQLARRRDDVHVTARELLDLRVPSGRITDAGLRSNVNVGIGYLEAWLRGTGAVALNNLMEDAATAEIARSQVWQWVQRGVHTAEGTAVTAPLVRSVADGEMAALRAALGRERFAQGRFGAARELFERVALSPDFVDFLTVPAYERID